MASFSDLPLDILVLIFPYLDPKEFLNLCRTCRSLAQPSIRNEPTYWSYQVRTKFRVPNRPAVQSDGLRWESLYKRLRTQSRVYTWGQNTHGCLGRDTSSPARAVEPRRGRGIGRRLPLPTQSRSSQLSTWPGEMLKAREISVVSDLQCGGWSTSLLTDKGIIYSVGVLDGLNQWSSAEELRPLHFDSVNNEKPAAHTTIRQFSSGRRHILGLSDDGTIWSWADIKRQACKILLPDLNGTVRSVVAGWDRSSALIRGLGIVLWDTVRPGVTERALDNWIIIPKTGYRRARGMQNLSRQADAVADAIGEVISYIVLENYVVFVTDTEKVFACRFKHDVNSGIIHDTFELTDLSISAKDVQGSFRRFAVFKGEGEVLIADQDYLDACALQISQQSVATMPEIMVVPALQNSGVIQLAFGDYHYHALHSDGSISSYGVEPGGSALGLGGAMDMGLPHGMLRGIKYNPWNHDGVLLPHAYARGRRIWFHKEQEAWVRFLANGGKDKDEAKERMRQVGSMPAVQGEVSEWVEQMGSNWHKRPEVQKVDKDGLGAYFALSVAAAGWHSGSLLLVNDAVVDAVRESCLESIPGYPRDDEQSTATKESKLAQTGNQESRNDDSEDNEQTILPPKGKQWIWVNQDFPRLRLDDGFEMEGQIGFTEWKEPKPDWKLRWTGDDRRVFGVSGWIFEE
ncbi:uncharacterized protein PV09_04996 [Verruconis gallopava]|uniref:F-box domain-containing protein n=1 Tax=Verruconis gallopava TaxID=253628 RepID=A0A0D2AAQ8_9PEZI|nr:uncharacterized protein PV09_04996 [Verruconis gallopava]KIW03675.1 hypothetical protein PV09_04996 [Verruconis gallopava]